MRLRLGKGPRGLLLLALFGLQSLTAYAAGGKVFIFYPSLVRPLVMQDMLTKKCPGLSITVFGRLTDLQALVAREHPEAIIAQAAVLKQFPDYQPKVQGVRNGSLTENYVLLSIDAPIDVTKVSSTSIGVVGILDRKEMNDFVSGLMPGTPRINRVTKVEDLLPLLIFRSVSAVLVSEANMKEFQKKSQAKLVDTRLEKAKVGLVAMGLRNGEGVKEIVAAFKGLDAEALTLLGVDGWK